MGSLLNNSHSKTKIIMQPIPVKVKNVSIYPYLGVGPVGPVVEPIMVDAEGTYSVGTLALSVFYNLDISGGDVKGSFVVHGRYIATGEYEDGSPFSTTWMFCTEAGDTPTFGRTVALGAATNDEQPTTYVPKYFKIGPLTDITVSQLFVPPAIGQRTIIENGAGNIIGTVLGTPHTSGVEVTKGDRVGEFHVGEKRVIITGKNADGHIVTMDHLTTVSTGEPAVFLRLLD